MKVKSKLLALLLALAMVFSLMVPAFAANDETDKNTTTAESTGTEEGKDGEGADPEASEAPAEPELEGTIVILHTNDVHGAIDGYAKVAALKAQYEEAGAEVLLMDAGDFSQGELEVGADRGAYAVELMNLAGYDVAAPGNHEFDYGFVNLKAMVEKAEFPVLAANVQFEGKDAFGTHVVLTAGEKKVGVFGLDTPETATKAHPAKIKGVTFVGGKDMYTLAQAEVKALQDEGCDYIICLGHLGIDDESATGGNRSIDLLKEVTGIDVFIDGHSHSTLDKVKEATEGTGKVGDTYLTSTGTKLANVGCVTLDGETITIESLSTEGIEVPEDSAVAARAAAMKADIAERYDAGKVGSTEVLLNGDRDPGNRTQETNLGDLVCDALLWRAKKEGLEVDAAFTNGGGIRATIKEGDITKRDVFNVLPFFNTLAVAEVTGEQLLEILEASSYCTPTAVGGFPQVAGIEYTIDTTVEFDQGEQYPDSTYYGPASIKRVTIQTVGGEEFDPEAVYHIATNDFLAAGGDTCYTLKSLDADKNKSIEVFLDEALMDYIAEELGGKVTAEQYGEPAGRITIKEAEAKPEPEPQPEPEPEPQPEPAEGTYTVIKGDNLSKIAKNQYGDTSKWRVIYEANKDIINNPNQIWPGQTLVIPAA